MLTAAYGAHPERFVRRAPESWYSRGGMDQSAGGGRYYDTVILHTPCLKKGLTGTASSGLRGLSLPEVVTR